MMESSEQCAYDGSLDPDDSSSGTERIVVASYEDYAREVMPLNEGDDDQGSEQVVGYLDEENATIVLQSQGIELDGKRLILAQGTGGDEIIVFVSSEQDPSIEHSLEQSISANSDDNHTLAIQCGSNNLEAVSSEGTQGIEVIGTNDGLQNIDKNGTVYVEQAHELAYVDSDNNHYSAEALGYHVQEKDDTTEMVFIPTTSQVISTGNNTRLLHLADVAHSEWATSELHEKEDIECTRKISEGSVIVSQTLADSDSHSSKVEDVSISVVNEQDNNNNLHDEHMTSEIEASSPAVEDNSSMLSLPSRDIDNAVSVIHVTSSTLVHDQDWRTKNIQEHENQTEESDQKDITLPAVSTNVINLECSNLKETMDSELSSQSPLIEESSNHSHLKDGTDSSNKDDNANYETSATVEETMDEDTNESIHFPPQLPSSENIEEDDSKQKDSISCNDNDSNTSMDVDQSQNVDNKISNPSSKNCENEMDFTNSEEACSEIEGPERTFLSLRDNSESKSSFFSDNSQSKDHNLHKLKKLKPVSPHKVKKVIDEYEFENSSSNLDQEFSHNSSLGGQPSDMVNSDDISTEVDATKVSQSVNSDVEGVTGNLTFQGALTPVTDNTKLNENLTDDKNNETFFDNSQDLFDHGSQDEEEHSSSRMIKNTNAKFFKNKQNSVSSEINHTDQDKKSDDKILAVKNGVDIDNKSKEIDSVVSDVASSVETTVKPPQRTYIRKRKTSDSDRNIELFSLDDLSDPKDETSSYLTPKIFSPDDQREQDINDENNLADEDGYVNLLPSDVKNRIKAKGVSSPVDERRTRSLRPRSDHPEKIPDPVMDAEDSVSTCWGAYLMETSFKPTNTDKTEGDAPKASSPDVPKVESPKCPLKKRMRTPSSKKFSAKNDSYKSGQQWDKLIKSSPIKMKDASSHKRKIREKVKKQVEKTLRNSENFNSSPISMPQRKKGRPSKDGKKNKTILHSSFSSPEKVKTCGIRFLNDNSIEKNNSSAIDELSTPSTSTQDLKSFQYTCSNCNFVSNKVNNLIIHLKYCTLKPSADMIDYRVNDMERRQRIRGDFTESYSAVGKSSTSQNFSNGSVMDDDDDELECSSPSQEGLSQENGDEYEKEDDDDIDEDEPRQNSVTNKKKFGYSANEIVWATVNNRFWPALVHKIDDDKLDIYLIDRPSKTGTGVTNVHMNVRIDSLPEQLHSFDDAKWTKKLLAEAEKLPDNDLFVKAVQKSDAYIRKRFIYDTSIDGIAFFDICKNVEYIETREGEDGNMIEENLDMNDEGDEESVDIEQLMECIFEQHCDKHVIDVYKESVPSRRHELHSQKNVDKDAANQLKHMSWFGPFKNNSQMQIRLHDYFIDLFKSNFGPRKDLISYIYEVWIPEGIIKAISIVKRLSLLEAQIIFYKQDMGCVDVEDFPLDDEDS
ncbi:hypothetical protein AVEN_223392-1 [Araneus ventricosus]|uniref:PWWP domain-containing protein n=1 Tax=Araneus ventricosus TaxID=182803 RepID=A0A4Y2KJ65_ARAVE|nr:hypothetical protein AVEN_223392-1 [Araneus ventricosus]